MRNRMREQEYRIWLGFALRAVGKNNHFCFSVPEIVKAKRKNSEKNE